VCKEDQKLTIQSEDEVEKVRLTLGASIKSLFLRSHPVDHPPPIRKSRGKGVWNSGWTRVKSMDDGEVECTVPGSRHTDGDSEDPGAFKVEMQILSESEDEVRILIQESDEAPFSPPKTNETEKKLFTLTELSVKSQQQERKECDSLLSQHEATESQQTSVPQLSSIINGPTTQKDRESKNSETLCLNERSVTPLKQESTIDSNESQHLLAARDADEAESISALTKHQVEMAQQPRAGVRQTQDQCSVSPDGVQLNKAPRTGSGEVAVKDPENSV